MGKNKGKGAKAPKGLKANVFKVAGAKSLKKTKAKAVNLGLKNVSRLFPFTKFFFSYIKLKRVYLISRLIAFTMPNSGSGFDPTPSKKMN